MSDNHTESCGWWTNGFCDCDPAVEIARLKNILANQATAFFEANSRIEKLEKLLKMAEDELIESDNHGREQSKRADDLEAQVEMLRDALSQMDLQICAAGDLMTKQDQQEALRLEALRDRVLKETEQ